MPKNNFYIIDRRHNPKGKSDSNRHRFLKRYHAAIKHAVKNAINVRSIKEAVKNGVKVRVSNKELHEYSFTPDWQTGIRGGVNVGNYRYVAGDLIKKPPQSEADGRKGSPDGEGEDDFIFNLSPEEMEHYFFDELELPNLIHKTIKNIEEYQSVRAGFTTVGNPCNLDLLRSMKRSIGREISTEDDSDTDLLIIQLQKEYDGLISNRNRTATQQKRIEEIRAEIKKIQNSDNGNQCPSLDKMDLQFRTHSLIPVPNTCAVMFCLMDVSGSMGEYEKDLAKRFFILLYLFLKREYETVEIRFIRHHSIAQEVEEEEFFYGRETGGTVVSSVMHKMMEIITQDYSDGKWNIYAAQASDGDNFEHDTGPLRSIMIDQVLRRLQYFAYIEVNDPNSMWRSGETISSIWATYQQLVQDYPNLAVAEAKYPRDIYPVFASLFKKRS